MEAKNGMKVRLERQPHREGQRRLAESLSYIWYFGKFHAGDGVHQYQRAGCWNLFRNGDDHDQQGKHCGDPRDAQFPLFRPPGRSPEARLDGDGGVLYQCRKNTRPSIVFRAEIAPSGQDSWQQ